MSRILFSVSGTDDVFPPLWGRTTGFLYSPLQFRAVRPALGSCPGDGANRHCPHRSLPDFIAAAVVSGAATGQAAPASQASALREARPAAPTCVCEGRGDGSGILHPLCGLRGAPSPHAPPRGVCQSVDLCVRFRFLKGPHARQGCSQGGCRVAAQELGWP